MKAELWILPGLPIGGVLLSNEVTGRRRKLLVSAASLAVAAYAGVGCHGRLHDASPESAAPKRSARTLEKAPWPVAAFVVPNLDAPDAERPDGTKHDGDTQFEKLTFPGAREPFPAQIYGNLTASACFRELSRRAIAFARVGPARGVDAPIRLKGRLHGVDVHGDRPRERDKSPYEILDCRLALAIDDFTVLLAAHGIVEAQHMSMYRPPVKPLDSGKHRGQHEAALAIDLGILTRADGSRLVIEDDYRGRIGAKTCGDGAGPNPVTENATDLREILCTSVDARTFNLYLTLNHDVPHHNHFHLEVMRHVKWVMVE